MYQIIYFGMALYMFRTVSPSIISISRLYIQLSNRYCCLLGCLLASKQSAAWQLYVQPWTPDDGRRDRPKHVECHSKIKQIWYIGVSSWFLLQNILRLVAYPGGFRMFKPPTEIPKALQKIVLNSTRLWKLLKKLLNLGRQHTKVFGKKAIKF